MRQGASPSPAACGPPGLRGPDPVCDSSIRSDWGRGQVASATCLFSGTIRKLRDPVLPNGEKHKATEWSQVRGLSGPRAQALPYFSLLARLLPLTPPRPDPGGWAVFTGGPSSGQVWSRRLPLDPAPTWKCLVSLGNCLLQREGDGGT